MGRVPSPPHNSAKKGVEKNDYKQAWTCRRTSTGTPGETKGSIGRGYANDAIVRNANGNANTDARGSDSDRRSAPQSCAGVRRVPHRDRHQRAHSGAGASQQPGAHNASCRGRALVGSAKDRSPIDIAERLQHVLANVLVNVLTWVLARFVADDAGA